MSKKKRLQDVLSQIAELASEAINGGHETYEPEEEKKGAAPAEAGCVIKSLPARLLLKAADVATRINPVNGLTPGRFAGMAAPGIPSDPARLALLVSKYWGPTPRTLTVSFMESTRADLRNRIISHLNAWTRTGCIKFAFTQGTGQVRISRGPGGYFSYLGTDIRLIPQGQQTMNLEGFTMNTSEAEFRRVVRHEAGHTLGFPHEHMRRQLIARLDREKTYRYFRRVYGWDRATVDAQVLTPLDERSIRGTPTADQDSIMCYNLPGEITIDGRPIRGGNDINQLDYDFCGRVYPKRDAAAALAEDEDGSDEEYARPEAAQFAAVGAVVEEDDWGESEDPEIEY